MQFRDVKTRFFKRFGEVCQYEAQPISMAVSKYFLYSAMNMIQELD